MFPSARPMPIASMNGLCGHSHGKHMLYAHAQLAWLRSCAHCVKASFWRGSLGRTRLTRPIDLSQLLWRWRRYATPAYRTNDPLPPVN